MREILSGILRPRDQLSERALVERFGASRTPVREAGKRLLACGLLTAGRRGMAAVRDIDQREVEEMYEVRLKLEAWAAPRTAALIRPEEITALEEINRRFEKACAVRYASWQDPDRARRRRS